MEIIGFSRNFWAYTRWCVTRHERAKYVEVLMEKTDIQHSSDSAHRDLKSSQIKLSEESIRKVIEAFGQFFNPFEVETKEDLFCLSSGRPLPRTVDVRLLKINEIGQSDFSNFIQDRMITKEISFHDPIKRNNIKTFKVLQEKRTVSTTQNKLVEIRAERNLFGRILLLSQNHELNLEEILSYSLSPIPWALATADGGPMKTDKSKLIHVLEQGSTTKEISKTDESIFIIDGMAHFQAYVNIPETFGELAQSVLDSLPNYSIIHFVTDTYRDISIKNIERLRRGSGDTFMIKGPSTNIPRNWKSCLCNNKNKSQLVDLLFAEWKQNKYARYFYGKKVYLTHGEECTLFTSSDRVKVDFTSQSQLKSNQKEADTRIILHCFESNNLDNYSSIRIRSPDTDVFMLLLRYAHDIKKSVLFDTGSGNHRRVIDVSSIANELGPDFCHALLNLHAFSGCDTTSSFLRHGKKSVLSKLEKNRQFFPSFKLLGQSPTVSNELLSSLEEFVCCIYSSSKKNLTLISYGSSFSAKNTAQQH